MQTLILAVVLTLMAGAASAADPVVGLWVSEADQNGNYEHVAFSECGAKICAKLVSSFDRSGEVLTTGNEGTLIIWDMEAKGAGRYSGGQLDMPVDGEGPGGNGGPEDDSPIAAKMRLSGEKLSLSACLMVGLVCVKQTWIRAE